MKLRIPALVCICFAFSYIMGCHEYAPQPVDSEIYENNQTAATMHGRDFALIMPETDKAKPITGV